MSNQPLTGRTVLVVDDDLESLNIAKIFLEVYGASVITAINGEQGIEKIKEAQPDIVFADLAMPKLSGWEMLEQVRLDPTTATIPIVALTASASMGTRDKALEAGFAEYLTKPFSPVDFQRHMTYFIELMNK